MKKNFFKPEVKLVTICSERMLLSGSTPVVPDVVIDQEKKDAITSDARVGGALGGVSAFED